jgi:outer membrane receptor protein involved in Fe transport
LTGLTGILFGLPSPAVNPTQQSEDNSTTYLFTPRLKLADDRMLYARFASGYRAGGPNTTATLFQLPLTFRPDTTRNYEVGFKGGFLDQRVVVDASVYYIDWRNIQLQLQLPPANFTYFTNASSAKSQGIELSIETRPAEGLRLSGWIAWAEAQLKDAFPPVSVAVGNAGDRLPFIPKLSGNVAIDYERPIAGGFSLIAGGLVSYVGDRVGIFQPTAERQTYAGYARADLRIGTQFDRWTANIFVNNAADRRGVLGGGLGSINPQTFSIITPRTIGLTVARTF